MKFSEDVHGPQRINPDLLGWGWLVCLCDFGDPLTFPVAPPPKSLPVHKTYPSLMAMKFTVHIHAPLKMNPVSFGH